MLEVKKKNGQVERFDFNKIKEAVSKSAQRVNRESELNDSFWFAMGSKISKAIPSEGVVTVEFLHRVVQSTLYDLDIELYNEYARYRDYKIVFNKTFQDLLKRTRQVIFDGDKENANKNSALVSTLKEIVGGLVSEVIALEYELPEDIAQAHKEGAIYKHDLRDDIFGSINCCLFDAGSVLKNGFNNNSVGHSEPKHISTAFTILGNIVLCASSQQFGGFTLPEIDSILAPYAEKQYKSYCETYKAWGISDYESKAYETTIKDIEQGYESIEYMLNTTNNALGQTPFVTLTFGLDTTVWGREIAKAILKVRYSGLGTSKTTAIFPKLVFLHREEVNGVENSPNYDIKQQAIECTMRRIYPDWLSLDNGYLGDMYDKYKSAISPMGW